MSGDNNIGHNSGHNNIGHNCGHVQSAWDTETVTRTVWHPGTSGEGASTTMYSQHRLVIHRVTVTQYQVSRHNPPSCTIISDYLPQWESGYATKLLLNIGGDMKQMSAVNGDYNIAGGQSCTFSGLGCHNNLSRMGS